MNYGNCYKTEWLETLDATRPCVQGRRAFGRRSGGWAWSVGRRAGCVVGEDADCRRRLSEQPLSIGRSRVVGERCSFSPVVFGEVLRAAWCVPMSDVVKKGLLFVACSLSVQLSLSTEGLVPKRGAMLAAGAVRWGGWTRDQGGRSGRAGGPEFTAQREGWVRVSRPAVVHSNRWPCVHRTI